MNRKLFIGFHKQAADIYLEIVQDPLVIIAGIAAFPERRDILL